jgi:hypothetical protein
MLGNGNVRRGLTYRERVHFLSLESWEVALCFFAAHVSDAQAVGGGFAVFDPFVGSRGVLYRGVQGKALFFLGEELEIARAGEDWAGHVSLSVWIAMGEKKHD